MQALVTFACAMLALSSPASAQEPAAIRAVVGSDLDEDASDLTAPTSEEPDEGPKTFHLDADASLGLVSVRFVSPADVIPALCPTDEPCDALDFDSMVLRGFVGIGLGGFTLEAGLELPLDSDKSFYAWTAGVRVDTSTESWVSIQVRIAYVSREGDLSGMGARGSAGLVVRPFSWGQIYGEASADVTSVPQSMNEAGTLFSYSYFFGGGLRFSFWLL
jgi:hypothetical protein